MKKIRIIFESGPLITSCKFQVEGKPIVDLILDFCEIVIPPSVKREVIEEGYRYPDSIIAKERSNQGRIVVKNLSGSQDRILKMYKLGDGEREAIQLYQEQRDSPDYLVIDDNLAYIVSDRLRLKKIFLLDLVLELVKRDKIKKDSARKIIEVVRSRYSEGFIEHSLEMLKAKEA